MLKRVRVATTVAQCRLGFWKLQAKAVPVVVRNRGRDEVVLISMSAYERLKSLHRLTRRKYKPERGSYPSCAPLARASFSCWESVMRWFFGLDFPEYLFLICSTRRPERAVVAAT